jgi:hypothetical protein
MHEFLKAEMFSGVQSFYYDLTSILYIVGGEFTPAKQVNFEFINLSYNHDL